ncbi:MAG: NTP transferase domain-containing protein [Candidatus Lindowbacteria bacterium]|nr:NTP transferase domain-containing protein [Candidatus Lindowbacteria bacterium]
MIDSVRAGLKHVNPASSGILVCLADHPLVKTETLVRMCFCHVERPHAIVLPVYHGKSGHPPLLPRGIAAKIDEVPTLKDLIEEHAGEVYRLEVNDEGVVLDMDTWEDYQRMLERCRSS